MTGGGILSSAASPSCLADKLQQQSPQLSKFAADPGEQWTPEGLLGGPFFSVHKSSAHFPHPDEACKPSSSSRPICLFILTQLRLSVRSGRLSRLLGTGGVEQHPALPWGFMPCLAAKQKKKKTPTDRFPCVFVWVGGGRGARCGRETRRVAERSAAATTRSRTRGKDLGRDVSTGGGGAFRILQQRPSRGASAAQHDVGVGGRRRVGGRTH